MPRHTWGQGAWGGWGGACRSLPHCIAVDRSRWEGVAGRGTLAGTRPASPTRLLPQPRNQCVPAGCGFTCKCMQWQRPIACCYGQCRGWLVPSVGTSARAPRRGSQSAVISAMHAPPPCPTPPPQIKQPPITTRPCLPRNPVKGPLAQALVQTIAQGPTAGGTSQHSCPPCGRRPLATPVHSPMHAKRTHTVCACAHAGCASAHTHARAHTQCQCV